MSEQALQSRMMVLLFSDIVGSVDLRTRVGDAEAGRLISRHDNLFRRTIEPWPGGEILKDTGDGFLARFPTVSDAVAFSLCFQFAMHREPWGAERVEVRIGLHVGEVFELEKEGTGLAKVSGLAVDLTARVMALGAGGQILMTRAAFDNARQHVREHPPVGSDGQPSPVLKWMAHGAYLFKGSDEPLEVYEVGAEGIAPLREPPDSEKARRAVKPGEEEMLGWRPGVGLEVPGRTGWVLERRLGEGGFGEVWLGTHRKTRVRRAFKFCYDYDRLRSLKRELTLFRLLREVLGDRPDIARLFEVRLDKAPFFLESEFTELGNLQDWSAAQGGIAELPMAARLDLLARTARAVAAAHGVGVLHKDIKPSNILLYKAEDGSVRPRLADFGIGVLTDPTQLSSHSITLAGFTELLGANESSRTGTRLYAPPETLINKPFTVQGDIYALGVLLYQFVVGDLDRPLGVGWERGVPDPLLREDIARCVAADESKRATSAQELVNRLETLDQRRRTARRRRLLRVGGLVAASLVVVLSIASLVLFRELSWARTAEGEARRAVAATKRELAAAGFVASLISAPDPSKEGRYDMSVRAALDRSDEQLQTRFGDDPETLATVHRMLGTTYKELGDYSKAQRHHSEALTIRRKLFPGTHAAVAESLNDLADVLYWSAQIKEAEPLYRDALAMRLALFGEHSADTAYTLNNLAACVDKRGDHAQAEDLYRRALAIRREVLKGEDRRLIAANEHNLAMCLRLQGKFDEAETLFRSAVQTMTGLRGEDNFDVARLMHNLGDCVASRPQNPDFAEGRRLMTRALEIKRKFGGPEHPSVATSLHDLADVLLREARSVGVETEAGRHLLDDANTTCRAAISIRAGMAGGRHPEYGNSLQLLSAILVASGKPVEAEEPMRQAQAIREGSAETGR